jgi:hypothetical protein
MQEVSGCCTVITETLLHGPHRPHAEGKHGLYSTLLLLILFLFPAAAAAAVILTCFMKLPNSAISRMGKPDAMAYTTSPTMPANEAYCMQQHNNTAGTAGAGKLSSSIRQVLMSSFQKRGLAAGYSQAKVGYGKQEKVTAEAHASCTTAQWRWIGAAAAAEWQDERCTTHELAATLMIDIQGRNDAQAAAWCCRTKCILQDCWQHKSTQAWGIVRPDT